MFFNDKCQFWSTHVIFGKSYNKWYIVNENVIFTLDDFKFYRLAGNAT